MAQPMPPQGQPPQGAPAQDPSQDPSQGQAPGGVSELINSIGQGLVKLQAMVQQAQSVPDEEKQMLGQIYQAYQEFVNNLSGDSQQEEQQDQKEPQGGPVPMETGGKPSQPAM